MIRHYKNLLGENTLAYFISSSSDNEENFDTADARNLFTLSSLKIHKRMNSGTNVIKPLRPRFGIVRSKLECSFPAGRSSLVQ